MSEVVGKYFSQLSNGQILYIIPTSSSNETIIGLQDVPTSLSGETLTGDFLEEPEPPSEDEALLYYAGLRSGPRLVARTGHRWSRPPGPEAYSVRKSLRIVEDHPITHCWEDLSLEHIQPLLIYLRVLFMCLDLVRWEEGQCLSPPIIWVGVRPGSLNSLDGCYVVACIQEVLIGRGLVDAYVEIREAEVNLTAQPTPYYPTSVTTAITEYSIPLSTTLGHPISSTMLPNREGTMGFYVKERDTERVLLATTRHNLFDTVEADNVFFCQEPTIPRHDVVALGHHHFNQLQANIDYDILERKVTIQRLRNTNANCVSEGRDPFLDREASQAEEIKQLVARQTNLTTTWAPIENRTIGQVVLSPPISLRTGDDRVTEDWALVEVDRDWLPPEFFFGNVIDLGTTYSELKVTQHMSTPGHAFQFPARQALLVEGIIPLNEMREGATNSGMPVLKRGVTTGLTMGWGSPFRSFVRHYKTHGQSTLFPADPENWTSTEWAILPHKSKDGDDVFSKRGDSGALIVDGQGRAGGIITGGSGLENIDITYATPMQSLLQTMNHHGNQQYDFVPGREVPNTMV